MSSTNYPFGDKIHSPTGRWSFENMPAEHFVPHARRSIPLYDEGHGLICDISEFFTPSPARVLELGCSTGALTQRLSQHHDHRDDIEFVALDVSRPMIEKCEALDLPHQVTWRCEDACTADLGQNDLVIAYYTLQFIPPRLRQKLLTSIYESLHWGGALILFEKVRGPDARFQDLFSTLYTDYKLQNGYDAQEIVNKTKSLKGVLEPFSTAGNLDLLHRAGFSDITTVLKYLCFEGFLAIK